MTTSSNVRDTQEAVEHLRMARNYLVRAGATRAADKVRTALKSAEGAVRHATAKQWSVKL